jgi:hypothetical protein
MARQRKHQEHGARRDDSRNGDLEGGHNQGSIHENPVQYGEGGHSQSSVNHGDKIPNEGGHNQASIGKKIPYGRNGRYNDSV